MKINFNFIFPVMEKRAAVNDTDALKFEHLTDLIIRGIGYKFCTPMEEGVGDCYDFTILEINCEGKNILHLLDALDIKEDIKAACLHHIHHLFNGEASDYAVTANRAKPAKVIQLPLSKKVNNWD